MVRIFPLQWLIDSASRCENCAYSRRNRPFSRLSGAKDGRCMGESTGFQGRCLLGASATRGGGSLLIERTASRSVDIRASICARLQCQQSTAIAQCHLMAEPPESRAEGKRSAQRDVRGRRLTPSDSLSIFFTCHGPRGSSRFPVRLSLSIRAHLPISLCHLTFNLSIEDAPVSPARFTATTFTAGA